MRSRLVAAALAAAVVVPTGGCGTGEPRVPAAPLRVATGSPGGVYFVYGQALADVTAEQVPALDTSVLVTAASAENIQLVATGRAELGFTQADIAADAARSRPGEVTALARLYDDYLHLVVRDGIAVRGVADLRGRTVSLGAPGSGTAVTAGRLLATARVDPARDFTVRRLGLDDSVVALRQGRVDAFFFSGGLPVAAVTDLARTTGIRLVNLGQYAAPLRTRYGPFYTEHTVPASTYGLPAVTTIGIPNYLVVSPGMPDATAYTLTRLLFRSRAVLSRAHPAAERLNAREAIHTDPLPLHPGARRYFREAKP